MLWWPLTKRLKIAPPVARGETTGGRCANAGGTAAKTLRSHLFGTGAASTEISSQYGISLQVLAAERLPWQGFDSPCPVPGTGLPNSHQRTSNKAVPNKTHTGMPGLAPPRVTGPTWVRNPTD